MVIDMKVYRGSEDHVHVMAMTSPIFVAGNEREGREEREVG
jgi:hypothetical protein